MGDMTRIRDRWINVFGALFLCYDIYSRDDFEKNFKVLTVM